MSPSQTICTTPTSRHKGSSRLIARPQRAHFNYEFFFLELYDCQLKFFLTVVKIQTASDAERLAAEGEAVRRDQRLRRSTSNFFPKEACASESDDPDEPSDAKSLNEKKMSSRRL